MKNYIFLFSLSLLFQGCVSSVYMQADPSRIKEVCEAAKPQFPKQGVPCRLLAPETSNDMVGQNKSFWDNTPFGYRVLYHYPLRDVMEDSFKNIVYEIFIPPGGNVLESFELSIKPSLSQMQIYDDTVNYRLDIYATFSEPGGKLLESFHLNESASGKLKSADKVPDIVYQTINKLALELMKKLLDSNKVVETIRGRNVASRTQEVKTTQVQLTPSATPSVVTPSAVTPSASGAGLRYAIVVGIKDYQNRGKWNLNNLRYASKDARAFADYLRSPQGGRFDKVEVLTDKQATTIAIRDVMKEKLREVREDDFVVVFWAGHGSPDPHDEKTLYLITHDTDPEHMASTAYPMAEFKADIARIKARQVLVIADTCYSAGIADPSIGLRGTEEANTIVEGMRGITAIPTDETSQSQPSAAAVPMRMIFTSCEQGEKSRESSEIGTDSDKGYGVFTFFLIESLKGAGDKVESGGDGNGIVSLGEAIEATRDKVIRYTKNQQHPATAGSFDRNIIMEKIK